MTKKIMSVDEEMVREGTDVLDTFIKPVHTDGKPRYYRLRYPVHAKEHKRRWSTMAYESD